MMLLGWLGFVIQVVGVLLAAWWLRVTWREFAPPGDTFLGPILRLLAKITPFRRQATVTGAFTADAITAAMDASATVTFGPLLADDRAAIEVLADRLQGLRTNFESTMNGIRRDASSVAARVDALEGHIDKEVERLDRADRHVATDGIRLEATGLVLVADGVVLAVIDAATRASAS
jgi:hypothetical protein